MSDTGFETFPYRDQTLAYEVHGEGPRVTVLIHGLLLDAGVNRALARRLAGRGHRVVLLDLPGHGRSTKPRRAGEHRMDRYADAVVGLLDHLGVREAVVGGVSLGADVALMAAAQHPRRVRALLLEMPVLERAAPFAALLFVPLLLALHASGRLGVAGAALLRRLPRTGHDAADSFLDAVSSHPEESKAVLHGLLVGPMAPTEEERARITAPTLVIGHPGDLLHPASDAARLARQLPGATLVRAKSFLELRLRPERLSSEIAAFLDTVWAARAVAADGRTRAQPEASGARGGHVHPRASKGRPW